MKKNYPCSHLRGMSWYVPSGRVLRTVRGSILVSSSKSAMSIGPTWASGDSTRIGAPIAICRALAPTIRARSNRVSLAGPMATSFFEFVSLVLSCTRRHSHATHATHSSHSTTTARWHRGGLHFS
jgi:hypothetical protein